ncbi:hypothetical protein BJ965_000563 [Streptomyces luteogriseus]|uniref:Lipoprotein n=1 Tax=Streptomyces luteogriseus TaxID=68233 RepID=A0A7W7DH98_9ACTN|nr:hypothetical protein [Streptomyces luteogriseus]MBB4710681.1 hypothetical protein [Streptomyces luteogriseus]
MSTSTPARRALLGPAAALALAAALTACGDLHASEAAGTAPSPSAPSSPPASGASPYVEPGAGDGAPHYNDNNAYRREGEMAPAHEKDARREADRIRPVLERLWKQREWDPEHVRAALLRLGYEEERVTQSGRRLGGTLTVTEMSARWKDDHYVTPAGARVALRVHADACVSAFVQKSNFEVRTNGPYPETGCFEPPYGH